MYNWKPLEEIDSSTLIEIPEKSGFRDKLDFNVAEMVKLVANQEKYSSIVVNVDNEDGSSTQYVHAGIAFFGGGKNYGVFENSSGSQKLWGFEVELKEVNKEFLMAAAGEESFYFMLCTSNSPFTPQEQKKLFETDPKDPAWKDPYGCIKAK